MAMPNFNAAFVRSISELGIMAMPNFNAAMYNSYVAMARGMMISTLSPF